MLFCLQTLHVQFQCCNAPWFICCFRHCIDHLLYLFFTYLRNIICASVCLYVERMGELCENGWTSRDAVWEADSFGPNEPCMRWVKILHGKGQFCALSSPVESIGTWESLLWCNNGMTARLLQPTAMLPTRLVGVTLHCPPWKIRPPAMTTRLTLTLTVFCVTLIGGETLWFWFIIGWKVGSLSVNLTLIDNVIFRRWLWCPSIDMDAKYLNQGVTLTFDLQHLTRSSVGANVYSLLVSFTKIAQVVVRYGIHKLKLMHLNTV